MLSHNYRVKLEDICQRIVKGETVELHEIIWAEKLSSRNAHAGSILRKARRTANNPEMQKNDMDDFLNQLDLGPVDPDDKGVSRFETVDEIVDFFRRDDLDDNDVNNWRRRD